MDVGDLSDLRNIEGGQRIQLTSSYNSCLQLLRDTGLKIMEICLEKRFTSDLNK